MANHDADETRPASPHPTHFGYREIEEDEKADRVSEVFESVARHYDLMNDLMTFGLHRRWKRLAARRAAVRPGARVLDLAGGTGDIAIRLAREVGDAGHAVIADINPAMLAEAERRLASHPLRLRLSTAIADAEALPFADAEFDAVTIGFGLRNVTHQDKALREMRRVLRPGGRLVILEFSRPVFWLVRPFYDLYSFTVLPTLGWLVVRDARSYRYLVESIRVHPDRDTLLRMLETAGYEACGVRKMFFGAVAIHVGTRAGGIR